MSRIARNLPFGRCAWLVLALVGAFASAHARVQKLDPGAAFTLAAGEGLLLIAVDTTTELRFLRIGRDGALFDGDSLKRVKQGRSAQLYVVPAGRYRFDTLRDDSAHFALGEDEEFAFEVKPGVVNYPGHLVYRPQGTLDSKVHVANRGLLAMDWLEQTHPGVARELDFDYTGHYPDPFPAAYRRARAKVAKIEHVDPPNPEPGTLPIPIEHLWRTGNLDLISLNRGGDLLAMGSHEERGAETVWTIDMVDLAGSTSIRLLESPHPISRIDWSGDRALVVSAAGAGQSDAVFIVRVMDDARSGKREYARLRVPRAGTLVDALPNDPDHILFASRYTDYSGPGIHVHRLDIRSQKMLDRFGFDRSRALDDGVKDARTWFTDGAGRLRAALAVRDEAAVLMHGGEGRFREVLRLDRTDTFSPFALSGDGESIYGFTEEGRGQRDLVQFDPATGSIARTMFSRPGVDTQGALFDAQRNLVGATYFEAGQLASHYFEPVSARVYRQLQRAFPGRSITLLDRDAAAKHFILMIGGSDQPSEVYHFDVDARRAALIRQTRPWLAGYRFAPTHLIRTTSSDGLAIEAFLTLPHATPGRRRPLVVFPHGGPIGVRDSRYFNPEVQFLASLGYAVLQVNFRGSEGYGSAFREAGRRNYGTLIEDDIDAALATALRQYPLDESRMCTLGSSYGGYSALISATRWPDRFRCAISISGISDQLLFFTASDGGRTAEGREQLEEALGSPHEEQERLRANSPLYRIGKLDLPVMLVHGEEDYRVDFEHTRRLARMLQLASRAPVVMRLEDEGHGDWTDQSRSRIWQGVAGFLRAHLDGSGEVADLR